MDDLFDTWCEATETTQGRKIMWRATQRSGSNDACIDEISHRARLHYASAKEKSDLVESLGFTAAAGILRGLIPESQKSRSADLGEILATEIIEEWCEYEVPIRKLRYKDHREQAMRGEDVVGILIDAREEVFLLKAEAKSARSLSTATVEEARASLDSNDGRPTAHSLIFIARRLLEGEDEDAKLLGYRLLAESAKSSVAKSRIAHCLFVLSGNPAKTMLDDDFDHADGRRKQFIIQIHIPDHQGLVQKVYEQVNQFAND